MNESPLPELTVISGILLAFLVLFIVHLYQKAHMKAWQTHVAKQMVEKEISERARIEEELNRTSLRIDLATKAGLMGVWTWDISSGNLTWNSRMVDLYDLPPRHHSQYDTWKNALDPDDRPMHSEDCRIYRAFREGRGDMRLTRCCGKLTVLVFPRNTGRIRK